MAKFPKYLIFKVVIEYDPPNDPTIKVGEQILDGTVLRRQDKLSSTTLHTYAALAQGTIEILEGAQEVVPHGSAAYTRIAEEIEGLERSKEYMMGEAELAQQEARKLPD